MDIYQFISSFKWPVVVLVALFIFRGPLIQFMQRMKGGKFGGWGISAEVELDKFDILVPPKTEDEKLAVTVRETKEALTKPSSDDTFYSPTAKYFEPNTPEILIFRFWNQFEKAIREKVERSVPREARAPNEIWNIQGAARKLGFSDNEIDSLVVLQNLRNVIVHSEAAKVTWDDAFRFQAATQRLMQRMEEHTKASKAGRP